MSISTNGQLCYGIIVSDEFEFPWDVRDDIDEWWLIESGFFWDGPKIFDGGDYARGFDRDSPEVDTYFAARSAWRKAHPCPVEFVNYCSCDYPLYIVAAKGSFRSAHRGAPIEIDPTELTPDTQSVHELIAFCSEYLGINGKQPTWYLSSLWC